MNVQCDKCGEPIEVTPFDRLRRQCRCDRCGALVALDEAGNRAPGRGPGDGGSASVPEGFECERGEDRLEIRWRWSRGAAFVYGSVLLGLVMATAVVAPRLLAPPESLAGLVGPLLCALLLGSAIPVLAYLSLANLINATTITASVNALHIRHGPLPWPGGGRVEHISQLFVKERVHAGGRKGGRSYSYELHALLVGDKRRRLVGGLRRAEEASWLERVIEAHLGIPDRPVSGELRRS